MRSQFMATYIFEPDYEAIAVKSIFWGWGLLWDEFMFVIEAF